MTCHYFVCFFSNNKKIFTGLKWRTEHKFCYPSSYPNWRIGKDNLLTFYLEISLDFRRVPQLIQRVSCKPLTQLLLMLTCYTITENQLIRHYWLNDRMYLDFHSFSTKALFLFQEINPISHCIQSSLSPWSLPIYDSFSPFVAFHDFDPFEEHWSSISYNITELGFVWFLFMIKLRLWILREKIAGVKCPSLCMVSGVAR